MTAKRLNSPTKMTRTLLWTNPQPMQVFAAQDVQIANLDSYDELWVEIKLFYSYINDNRMTYITKAECTHSAIWAQSSSTWSYMWTRQIRPKSSYIAFEDAYQKNLRDTNVGSVANDRLVPYKVYGVNYS